MVRISILALSLSVAGVLAAPPVALDARNGLKAAPVERAANALPVASSTVEAADKTSFGFGHLFTRWSLGNVFHADAASTPQPHPPKPPGSPHPPKPQPSATVMRTWALGKLNVTPGIIAQLENGYYVSFQGDANLVVYGPSNAVEWASGSSTGTGTCSGCYLTFQGDGNLVIYNAGAAIWSTGTGGTGHILQAVDGAPFLVIRNSAKQPVWEA